MKKTLMCLLLTVTLSLALFPGCSVSDTDTVATEAEKIDAYIALNNELAGSYLVALGGYAEAFGWAERINVGDDFHGFTLSDIPVIEALDEALKYADKAPVKEEADNALKALDTPLRNYCETLKALGQYYREQEYLKDNFVQGQAYHTLLVGEYESVSGYIHAYTRAVETMLSAP